MPETKLFYVSVIGAIPVLAQSPAQAENFAKKLGSFELSESMDIFNAVEASYLAASWEDQLPYPANEEALSSPLRKLTVKEIINSKKNELTRLERNRQRHGVIEKARQISA